MILDLYVCHDTVFAAELAKSFFFFFDFQMWKDVCFYGFQLSLKNVNLCPYMQSEGGALSEFSRKQTGYTPPGVREFLRHPKKGRK